MTLATTGSNETRATSPAAEADKTLKTAFDCDVLTLARDAKQHASKAMDNANGATDPMDSHYRPIGSKAVRSALRAGSPTRVAR